MKLFTSTSSMLAVLASVSLITPTFAEVNIDWVTVGNAGNAADTTGYGSVGYDYRIGKFEVTNAQYAEFLNAKGGLLGLCFLRVAPERAIGSDRRAGKWGLMTTVLPVASAGAIFHASISSGKFHGIT